MSNSTGTLDPKTSDAEAFDPKPFDPKPFDPKPFDPKPSIDWLWLRPKRRQRHKSGAIRVIESALVAVIAALACLLVGEFGVRIAMRAPLLEWRDFRHARAAATINHLVQYDSLLGWRLKAHIKSSGFNTLEYGFRSNGDADAKVQTGGVLAIGSSYTAGSGVADTETWPAHLQQLTGWNVNNAGEGGYQADQIILLGEQLLPLIRPRILVIDLIPGTIIGTGYASSGWPKPYFTVENGDLVAHNSPVPQSSPAGAASDVRQLLGHSAVINRFMAAFFPNFWFTSDGNSFATVSTDEVGVTCRLLERLKRKADTTDTGLVLYLQFGGLEVADGSLMATAGTLHKLVRWLKSKVKPLLLGTPPGAPEWQDASARVGQCARSLGIAVADELPSLMAVYQKNPDDLRKYYQIEAGGVMGHKSSFGNMAVAKLVAAAIGNFNGSTTALQTDGRSR
jgi:hypothetical protein